MIELLRSIPYKTYIGLFFCSLFASYWLVPRIVWLAQGLGIFTHTQTDPEQSDPSIGGLAIGLPFVAGISLLLLLGNQVTESIYMVPLQTRGLFFGSCLILVVGFLQDYLNLKRYVLIALQTGVASSAYYYGFRSELLSGFGLPSVFFTLIWIVGIINLLDLLNRRSHLFVPISLMMILCLSGVAYSFDQHRTIAVCCLLSGSLTGILSHQVVLRSNVGSTGTFFIGFVVATAILQSNIVGDFYSLILPALPVGVIVLFLMVKTPLRLARLVNRTTNQSLRSLHYLRQAFALRMKLARNPTESWNLLCQAAQTFGYERLNHRTNMGESVREWIEIENSVAEEHVFPLRLSGGWLHAHGDTSDFGVLNMERKGVFTALVRSFDEKLESSYLTRQEKRQKSLRVLLVNRYFSGMSATGQIIEDLAEDLTQQGAAVTVLTGGLSYENSLALPGRNEIIRDIHVCRVPATYFGRTNSLNRSMDFIFFYLYAFIWLLKKPANNYTHIVTFTDPPLIAVLGYFAKILKRWKFIYSIQDLYPETALALGMMKKSWGYHLAFAFNKVLLKKADAIATIGQKMSEHIRGYIGPDKCIKIIPNWADGQKIVPVWESQHSLRKKLKLRDVYTAMFAGNMGIAQEIDVLIELVKRFSNRADIQFLFMGGGVRRTDLEEAVSKQQNVHFLDYQPRSCLSSYLGLADIGIVTLSPNLEGLAIPTKTYSYLAAGIPILAIAGENSEFNMFSDLGLGVHFSPAPIEKIVGFLETELQTPNRRRNTFIRNYFESNFDRPYQTQKYITLLHASVTE